ncbi:MAG: hypothetical protein ACFFDT_19860 [Candidatus Hodarchaeota archaeon]
MLKARKNPLVNYRFLNCCIIALLVLSFMHILSFTGNTGRMNGESWGLVTNMDDLYPEEYQNLPERRPDTITDKDFATAEIAITIAYNLTAGLEVTLGVEEARTTSGGSGATAGLTSQTGLSSIGSRRSGSLWNDNSCDPYVTRNIQHMKVKDKPINVTTITAKVQHLGFSKDDLKIKTDLRHWYVTIKDNNPPPLPIDSSGHTRHLGWLESFTITVGDTRYASLLHPVFAAGWEVTAYISGRAGEIYRENVETQMSAGGGASLAYHDYSSFEATMPVYGIAGIIGIEYFENLDRLYEMDKDCNALKNFLLGTGIWEIYYMVTQIDDEFDDTGWIDKDDVIYFLDDIVNGAIGSPACVDHCFWFIGTHGGGGSLCTSFAGDNVPASDLADIIASITSKDVWFFYWMGNCGGDSFASWFWYGPSAIATHNYHALFWCYTPEARTDISNANRELSALEDHVFIGQKSCQWMFNGRDDDNWYHIYENYEGDEDKNVRWVEDAFERNHGGDMQQHDTMVGPSQEPDDDYEFCFVPNSDGWVPTCRTRGEPSDYVYKDEFDDWEAYDHKFMLEAKETDITFQRYVGFYKRVYVPEDAFGGNEIFIELEGRAKSDWGTIKSTNLYVMIYSDDWEDQIATWEVFPAEYGRAKDSGWLEGESHTFEGLPVGTFYNVLICYSDGWNYAYHQQIFVKNIYIGNVLSTTRFYTAFEHEPLEDGWQYSSGPGVFVRDSSRKISYSYSGHHDGGSGNVYRMDKWVTPGTHTACTLTGWVYNSHYNYYSVSQVFPVYYDYNDYIRLYFYRNYVRIYSNIDGDETYTQTSTQNWNNKWWQFEVTVHTSTKQVTGWVKTGTTKYTLNTHIWTTSSPLKAGYVAIKSRIGSYGDYWYDDFEIWW